MQASTKCPSDIWVLEDEAWEIQTQNGDFLIPKTKPARKRRTNENRYDSLYRSLLRRFRKFFNLDFDRFTNYKSSKRSKPIGYFLEWVSKYLQQVFPEHYSEDLMFHLSNLIYPNILIQHWREFSKTYPRIENFIQKQMASKINVTDILLVFTFSKMEKLLLTGEYALLFHHFAQQNYNMFSATEQYAVEQMAKLWNYANLLASPSCP